MIKKLTLKDIAQLSGVSLTTASMYINGKAKQYKISQTTCDRIAEVIRKYKFYPNTHARAIAGKKTFLIGVIIPNNINRSFWIDILEGINSVITPKGYHILLSVSHPNISETLKSLEFSITKGVDGIIFAIFLRNKRLIKFLKDIYTTKPLVSINSKIPGIPAVYNDNAAGGRAAAEYLYLCGHKKIAYVGMHNHIDGRDKAFSDTLSNKNINIVKFKSVDDFKSEIHKFTAVGCINDYYAMNVYKVAEKCGISIPDALSVIGFDNLDFSSLLHPKLTTIHQYKRELGVVAAENIMRQLENNEKSVDDTFFISQLIKRESVRFLLYK